MPEQTSIPVPNGPTEHGPCRWCGAPSVGTVEVEKPRYRNDRGVRVVAKAALEVPACSEHIRILDHQPKEKEAA
jgi:hypothetical protein